MESLRKLVGKRIAKIRENSIPKLSQAELAIKIGVKSDTVSRWETGKRWPQAAHFEALCDSYGVPPHVFFDNGIVLKEVDPNITDSNFIKVLQKKEEELLELRLEIERLKSHPVLFAYEKAVPDIQLSVRLQLGLEHNPYSPRPPRPEAHAPLQKAKGRHK